MQKLNAYNEYRDNPDVANLYKVSFLEECMDARCDDATTALAASITG